MHTHWGTRRLYAGGYPLMPVAAITPHRLLLASLLLFLPAGIAHAQSDLSLAARQADFAEFVHDFQQSYAYLDQPQKPWLTWETRYADAVKAADTKEAFADVLASALSELHDFHAEVRSRVIHDWLPVPSYADLWADSTSQGVTVNAVKQGGDAEHVGVHVGDRVLSVNAVPIEQAIANRLGPTAQHADAHARQWALLSVLTGQWKVDRELSLQAPDGHIRTVHLPGKRHFDRGTGELTTKLLAHNVGYIRLNNSLGNQKTVAAFDEALASFQYTRGLVLDLRDVPSGGDSSVALGIMGRFVTELRAYQRHRIPHYGQSDVERNWVEFVAPRGPFTYTAPVVVLVNHWTGSMGEGMAVGFDAMHRATVVGTPMAHLAGAVSDDKLSKTGIDLAYATEQILHVNGTPRQAWFPPVLVSEPLPAGSRDTILDRGLSELNKPVPMAPKPLTMNAPKPAQF